MQNNDLLGYLEQFDYQDIRSQTMLLDELRYKCERPESDALSRTIALLEQLCLTADELGIDEAFNVPSKNENCLENVRCPECSYEDSFEIAITTLAIVHDDGSEPVGDQEWDNMSHIRCRNCDHEGRLWQFRT